MEFGLTDPVVPWGDYLTKHVCWMITALLTLAVQIKDLVSLLTTNLKPSNFRIHNSDILQMNLFIIQS